MKRIIVAILVALTVSGCASTVRMRAEPVPEWPRAAAPARALAERGVELEQVRE
jgi:uncharacterized protein YceK